MKPSHQNRLLLAASVSMMLALAACDRYDQRAAGQKLDSVATQAKEEVQDAAARARAAADKLGDQTKSMGAGAVDKVDDASITAKVNAALAADKDPGGVILDHLGDAHLKAGDGTKAREAWQKAAAAFEKDGEKEKLAAVRKKLAG